LAPDAPFHAAGEPGSGLARAKAQGKRLGRPRVHPGKAVAADGLTVRAAARLWHVSKSTAAHWRRLADRPLLLEQPSLIATGTNALCTDGIGEPQRRTSIRLSPSIISAFRQRDARSWFAPRPLRNFDADWQRRHGRGLSGEGHKARSGHRAEDPARHLHARSGTTRTIPS